VDRPRRQIAVEMTARQCPGGARSLSHR
jgi:hypothetical protein